MTRAHKKRKSTTLKNWHKLILCAARRGFISLKTVQSLEMRDIITKLEGKEKKRKKLDINGRWRRLTNILLRKANQVKRTLVDRSSALRRWHRLICVAQRKEILRLKTVKELDLKQVIILVSLK